MASFNLSPYVDWEEQDYSLAVSSQVDTIGAMAGCFKWGPAGTPVLLTNGEDDLVQTFGKPTNDLWMDFMILKDFFRYSSKAYVVRAIGPNAMNSAPRGVTPVLVRNDDDYEASLTARTIPVIGKFPGAEVNGLALSIGRFEEYSTWDYVQYFDFGPSGAGYANAALVDTTTGRRRHTNIKCIRQGSLTSELESFIKLTFDGKDDEAINIPIANTSTVADAAAMQQLIFTALSAKTDIDRGREVALSESVYFTNKEVGVFNKLVITTGHDSLFKFEITNDDLGFLGDLVEIYEDVHLTEPTAVKPDGSAAFFAEVAKRSSLIRIGEDATFDNNEYTLVGGVDDNGTAQAPLEIASEIDILQDSEAYDINFLISGAGSVTEQQRYSDVASTRRDCLAFHAAPMSAVVGNPRGERDAVKEWREVDFNKVSSYDVLVDNWGQLYDDYNMKWRWIPLCGGTAGLTARTYVQSDPWFSPAFHNRGVFKSYRKLAWSASKADRDILYPAQINSIINKAGDGQILYGDKTGINKNVAFSRINVRSLFIVVEKSIASMSRFFLGEVNDEVTQTQFLNTVQPYLRSVQNRRGMEGFRVVCDERNNDGQAKANNEFHAAFFIKPLYSINFIKLVFAAVRSDVSFEEVEQMAGIA